MTANGKRAAFEIEERESIKRFPPALTSNENNSSFLCSVATFFCFNFKTVGKSSSLSPNYNIYLDDVYMWNNKQSIAFIIISI